MIACGAYVKLAMILVYMWLAPKLVELKAVSFDVITREPMKKQMR